jgi:hypothetical protein
MIVKIVENQIPNLSIGLLLQIHYSQCILHIYSSTVTGIKNYKNNN